MRVLRLGLRGGVLGCDTSSRENVCYLDASCGLVCGGKGRVYVGWRGDLIGLLVCVLGTYMGGGDVCRLD